MNELDLIIKTFLPSTEARDGFFDLVIYAAQVKHGERQRNVELERTMVDRTFRGAISFSGSAPSVSTSQIEAVLEENSGLLVGMESSVIEEYGESKYAHADSVLFGLRMVGEGQINSLGGSYFEGMMDFLLNMYYRPVRLTSKNESESFLAEL